MISDDYDSAGLMIGLAIGFSILPSVTVALRIWAKKLSRRGLGWDDYLIFCALVFSLSFKFDLAGLLTR